MSEKLNDGFGAEKKKKKKKVKIVEINDDVENMEKSETKTRLPDPFTCYISACPEPRNAEFKEPEFLVCYKCPSTVEDPEGRTKYFCYPIMAHSAIDPNVVIKRAPPKETSTSSSSEEDTPEEQPYIHIPQWYAMNQGFQNYCQSTYHQFPQYVHQQQQQQQPQRPFYHCSTPYAYQNFDGNFYFFNGASQNV